MWNYMIMMVQNSVNIRKTSELCTSKGEIYCMWIIFQLLKSLVNRALITLKTTSSSDGVVNLDQ